MTGQILVPLRGSDRIELFLPYIQQLAQPGMRVVFLVHLGLSRFKEITDQLLAIHMGLTPVFPPSRNGDRESLNQQSRLAREAIFRGCLALRERGIEISVHVFAGPMRAVVGEFVRTDDVHLVIMRGTTGNWPAQFLRKLGSLIHLFGPPTLPPVLLFHPSSILGRINEKS